MLTMSTLIIVARPGLPVKDGKELIAWLKANPNQATMAHVGAGSGAHVCGLYFEQKTGTRVHYVPYKGGAPSMTDLMANQVDLFCGEGSQMLEYFRAGPDQAAHRHVEDAVAAHARDSDHGGPGRLGHLHPVLARPVGAEGNPEERHRAAERCRRQGLRRSGGHEAADRARDRTCPRASR